MPDAELVMNTVPCHVLGEQQLKMLPKDTPVLDLASKPGGDDVAAVYAATVLRAINIVYKGCEYMGQRGKITAQWGTKLAFFLSIAAMLLYAAVHYEHPAEPEVCKNHIVTKATQASLTAIGTQSSTTSRTTALCCDLNAATVEDLMRVRGIGSALAEKIVAARIQQGRFERRSDLLVISGIGEALMERIMAEFYIADELPAIVTTTTKTPAATEIETTVTAGRYDLNLVTKEELMRIPDMTEAIADGILELRTTIQYYTHLYELLYVDGISGTYLLDVLEHHLYIAP